MRKSRKIKIVLSLILSLLLVFFCTITFKILYDYSQITSYKPIKEVLKSIENKSISEFEDAGRKIRTILQFGYEESNNQAINIFTVDDVSDYSELDSYYIYIDNLSYSVLNSDLPTSGFVEKKGYLVYNGKKMQDVKLRYRGDSRWHWYFTQKSWRVKTDKNELINGSRKLNLTNATEKSFLMDYLSYKVGEKMGILTYEASPVRVFLNNQYMGVYVSVSQLDEYFLRNNKKLPSEIYSGDLISRDADDPSSIGQFLWNMDGLGRWEKSANNNSILEEDFTLLENLIKFVEENKNLPYNKDIEKMVDIDKYLKWKAALTILSSVHIDNRHNNKLYFDPSSGKFEPILWDTDGLEIDKVRYPINMVYNDLDRCILKNPEHFDIFNKYIWESINGPASEQVMISEIKATNNSIKSDVYSDAYKDYLELTQQINRSYTNEDFDNSIIEAQNFITDRYASIRQSLTDVLVDYKSNISNNNTLNISLDIIGHSGVNIQSFELSEDLNSFDVKLYRDINFNSKIDKSDELVDIKINNQNILTLDETIYPSRKYNPGIDINTFDFLSIRNDLFKYDYILDMGDNDLSDVQVIKIKATNSVTGQDVLINSNIEYEESDDIVLSTHPWEIQDDIAIENVVFNSGEYIIEEDIIVNKLSSLTISEGAVLKLKEGVSIYAFGQVDINGTEQNPVIIEPYEEDKPWGVFAIQGHYNPDLVHNIDHAVIRGGGVPQTFENAMYTGMLSAYNSNIVMTNTSIISNRVGDDGFNSKQGNVEIDHCYFYDAYSDAVDLDYATGSITNSYFESNGNDAIDLMTTSVEIENNYIFDSGDKGISVGERSHPEISNNVITSCNIGIEIKDLSDPQIRNVVLYSNNKAVNVYHKNDKYESGGRGDIFNSIIANSFISSVTVDKDSKLNISDSVFDTQVYDTKDLDLKNCRVADIKKGDLTIENAGLNKPIEMWWE